MPWNRKPETPVDIPTSPSATGSDPFTGPFLVVETKNAPRGRRRPGWLSAERQLARARQQGSAAFLTHTLQTSHLFIEVATRATVGRFRKPVPSRPLSPVFIAVRGPFDPSGQCQSRADTMRGVRYCDRVSCIRAVQHSAAVADEEVGVVRRAALILELAKVVGEDDLIDAVLLVRRRLRLPGYRHVSLHTVYHTGIDLQWCRLTVGVNLAMFSSNSATVNCQILPLLQLSIDQTLGFVHAHRRNHCLLSGR